MDLTSIGLHSQIVLSQWLSLNNIIAGTESLTFHHSNNDRDGVRLDGKSLDLASIVAVSRYFVQPE